MAWSKSTSGEKMSENTETQQSESVAPIQMRVERMYLKDASFESPGSPTIFSEQWKPETQVDINTKVDPAGENRFEVILSCTVTSKRDSERVAFVAEVQYAGLFVIEGAQPGGQLNQILGIACPTALFPYLRENLDSLCVRGGFPALNLAPVNFEALFKQAMQHAQSLDD